MRIFYVLLSALLFFAPLSSAEKHSEPASDPFYRGADVQLEIDAKLALAKRENKKLLLVLGAQWCHDTQGLLKNFNKPELKKTLQDHYEVVFVDVAYLNKGFDVAKRFGLPIYYGTPTVMVVDPDTETLINRPSMTQWLSADSVSYQQYKSYFAKMSEYTADAELNGNKRLADYLSQIQQYEETQAKRIKLAYQRLGPVLENYQENGVDFSEKEDDEWRELARFRYGVQKRAAEFRQQARDAVKNQQELVLLFPSHKKFSWE
ncbi:thioredoxin family protein [uncultured Pseudoteredinibacter sp.]|uniref:thioredoxin family protein n=1 Tax=uncultured Pseudoteredinibacter sp. TaxID=1641701 RepID=UPI002636AF1A|nr:thioredoxin family protein [uncultured Pseudoteredinibacter sp.]